MNKPKFSFIIPVYNAELYLSRCLDSLLNQDVKEIEIIVVNDGSTDKSLAILQEYQKKNFEIFTIITQNNCGIGPSRNNGLKIAKGEYIWFIDNDDCIMPNCLLSLYNTLKITNCDILDIGFIHSCYNVNPLLNIKLTTIDSIQHQSLSTRQVNKKFAFYFKKDYPWSKIYKHSFLVSVNCFFPDVYGEDTAIVYNLYAKASSIFEIDDTLYAWFNRSSSFSNDVLTYKHFTTLPLLIDILLSQAKDNPELSEEFNYIVIKKSKLILDFFNSHKTQTAKLEIEKQATVDIVEKKIKLLPFNFYINLDNYINNCLAIKENEVTQNFYRTFSWKITKPFRFLQSLLRKLIK